MMINTSTFSKGLIIFLVCYLEIIVIGASNFHEEKSFNIPIEKTIEIEETLLDLMNKENNRKKFTINLKTIESQNTVTPRLNARITASLQLGMKNELLKHTYPIFKINSPFDNAYLLIQKSYSNIPDNTMLSQFIFYSYAPFIFDYLRIIFGIDKCKYVSSFCDTALIELPNPGASISQLYFTKDNKFIMKSVQYSENACLLRLLSKYHKHFINFPNSLLPKFSGFYGIQYGLFSDLKVVTMNNLLPSNLQIDEKFDLKGSTLGRTFSGTVNDKKLPTFKDLDFNKKYPSGILLEKNIFSNLIKTLKNDCKLLQSLNIMDYSLLMGIFNIDVSLKNNNKNTKLLEAAAAKWTNAMGATKDTSDTAAIHIDFEDDSANKYKDLFKDGIPAMNHRNEKLLLFVGIIDVLQTFRVKKKFENKAKKASLAISSKFKGDVNSISVQPSDVYSNRFMKYMKNQVFTIDYSSLSETVNVSEDEQSNDNGCIKSICSTNNGH